MELCPCLVRILLCNDFLLPTLSSRGTGAREVSTDVCEQIRRSFEFLGVFEFRYGASLVLQKSSMLATCIVVDGKPSSPGWGSPEVPNDVAWRFDITSVLVYMDFSKNRGTPKSSILIGFSIINRPFWDTTIFGNTYIHQSILMMSPLTTSLTFDRNVMRHVWSEGASSTADQTRGPEIGMMGWISGGW